MPRTTTVFRLVAWAIVGFAVTTCARVSPPPGGPEDRDPPRLALSVPADNEAAVSPVLEARLVFSEKTARRSVMKSLRVIPDIDLASTSWSADTLLLVPQGGWPRESTTILWVGPGAEDARGNPLGTPIIVRFTTRSAWGAGSITGRVAAGREATPETRLVVTAFPGAELDSTIVLEANPEAIVLPAADGVFRFTQIPAGTFRVVALLDRDGDARAGGRDETWAAAQEPVVVGNDSAAVVVPAFLVGTLDSAGTISGDVLVDSGAVVVEAHADSARASLAARSIRAGTGTFSIGVATGRVYFVSAFADADGDSSRGADESGVPLEEPVDLRLTSKRDGLRFDLRGESASKAPSDSARGAGEKGRSP